MPKTHRPKEKSFSCNGSNMMMPERSIATGNVVFVFFFLTWTRIILAQWLEDWTSCMCLKYNDFHYWILMDKKKIKKNVAMFNLKSVSVWCHLNVLPPPAATWMRYLVLSVGTPAAPLTEPSGFAKVGVRWTSTLHDRLFSSAEVTVSKTLSGNTDLL